MTDAKIHKIQNYRVNLSPGPATKNDHPDQFFLYKQNPTPSPKRTFSS